MTGAVGDGVPPPRRVGHGLAGHAGASLAGADPERELSPARETVEAAAAAAAKSAGTQNKPNQTVALVPGNPQAASAVALIYSRSERRACALGVDVFRAGVPRRALRIGRAGHLRGLGKSARIWAFLDRQPRGGGARWWILYRLLALYQLPYASELCKRAESVGKCP